MNKIKIITNICLIIALYYLTYYIYIGFFNPIPALGDSWDYHIPIANTILDGKFLFPINFKIPQWYYPGSSEIFLSLFILLKIPLTLSNILPIIILSFSIYKLGLLFRLSTHYSLLFTLTFSTLNAVLRWMNAVSIDVWVAVWFILGIIMLERPEKKIIYFAKLGLVLGMLIGSKYSACFLFLTLTVFYIKRLLPFFNLYRFVVFLFPFSIFGLFWYIRNYIFTKNPFYPLPIFGLDGKNIFGGYNILDASLTYPLEMLNASFGEYKLWTLSVVFGIIFLIYKFFINKQYNIDRTSKLFLIGLLNFLFFFSFPTSEQTWIMVSSFRYSFPVFIPLILGVFLLASKYKKEESLSYFAIANMLPVLSMAYYPKLILIYLPLALLILYFINKSARS